MSGVAKDDTNPTQPSDGTVSAPDAGSVDATAVPANSKDDADARAAHQSFKGDNGKPLVIRSAELWVPPSLEQAALEVVQAERLANGASNVMRNLSKVVVCPWLTA